jgi:transposase
MLVRKYSGEEIIRKAEAVLKECKDAGVYKRAMSVLLTARDGFEPQEAAQILGICLSTLTKYRKEFSLGTYNQPKSPKTSNSSHLTWEQEEEVLSALEERARRGEMTTVWQIKEEYEKATGFAVGKSTIYRFLERHGWRKIQPRPSHPKSNKEAGEEFKKNCRLPWRPSRKKPG